MGMKTSIEQEKLIFANALKKPHYLLSMGDDFYSNPDIQYLANAAKEFYKQYKTSPTSDQLKASIKGGKKEIESEIIDTICNVEINAYDSEWLSDITEGWIKFRTLNHNLFEAITLIKTADISLDNVNTIVHKAASIVGDTNLVSFDRDLGDDFFDPESHKNVKANKIPFTWDTWNKWSSGGLDHKTLSCYIGGTNVGKCCQYDTKIRVRNKKTGEIKEISIGDFFKHSQH